MWEGLLSARAHFVATAVAFLIAGSVTASAEVEDIGRPAAALPDGDAPRGLGPIQDGQAFGDAWTPLTLWTSRDNFTSPSRGGKFISSLGSDRGPPTSDQDGGGRDYESNADYSSSTLEGGRFPATVTDFGAAESLIQNDLILFGESDHFGFDLSTSGYSSPSTFDVSLEDRTSGRHSAHCSSDGSSTSVVRCQTDEALGSFVTTSGAGPDGAYQSGRQSSSPSGPSGPSGGSYLSAQQMLSLEMIAAQNMTWQWDVSQGTFTPPCDACDVIPPVSGASTSDFVDPTWSSVDPTWSRNSDPTSIRPKGALFVTSVDPPLLPAVGSPNSDPTLDPPIGDPWGPSPGAGPPPAVPEIPQWAMLLIGFGGLALLGRRRLGRSARLGQEPGALDAGVSK